MKKLMCALGALVLYVCVLAAEVTGYKLEDKVTCAAERAQIEKILKENGVEGAMKFVKPGSLLERIYTIEKRSNCTTITNAHYLHFYDFSDSFYIAIRTSAHGSYYYAFKVVNHLESVISSAPESEVKCLDEKKNPKTEILYQWPWDEPFIAQK